MAFRVRSSKFRHVFGSVYKKEHCYECIKITKNAHDSNFCAVNPRFLAVVVESAGGGSFVVLPVDKVGRIPVSVLEHVCLLDICTVDLEILARFYLAIMPIPKCSQRFMLANPWGSSYFIIVYSA